ncbi:MAG: alcohol dehydrogenase catalytic domain-containing protein [Syntrophobacteria bacterium]
MKAMVLKELSSLPQNRSPLERATLADPVPGPREVLVRVLACGVCHTELDQIEGRMPPPRLPVVLGHQVVGRVEQTGSKAHRFKIGDRVGIAWIFSACGRCKHCLAGRENLCRHFMATGRDANGGYAQYMTVSEDFAYGISGVFSHVEVAPLLCAGAIGYRALKLTGLKDGQNLGLTGFGASAHIVLKLVRYRYPGSRVFVFARNPGERAFSREQGAFWAGDIAAESPEKLDCAIDTTPVWKPVVETGVCLFLPGLRLREPTPRRG